MSEYVEDTRTDEELVAQAKAEVEALNLTLEALARKAVSVDLEVRGFCTFQCSGGGQVSALKVRPKFSKVLG